MKDLFYFLAIFPLVWEFYVLTNAKEVYENHLALKKQDKKTTLSMSDACFAVFMFFYTVWNFIGLFSFQWFVFLMFFVLSLIPKKYVWMRFVDAFTSIAFLLFIVLNAYHFHIDVWQIVKSYF